MLLLNSVCYQLHRRHFYTHLPTQRWCSFGLFGQNTFFDDREFYRNVPSYHFLSLTSAYKHYEDAKKRECGHLVRDIKHGVFILLDVFTLIVWYRPEDTMFYCHLADLPTTQWGQEFKYSKMSMHRATIWCKRWWNGLGKFWWVKFDELATKNAAVKFVDFPIKKIVPHGMYLFNNYGCIDIC